LIFRPFALGCRVSLARCVQNLEAPFGLHSTDMVAGALFIAQLAQVHTSPLCTGIALHRSTLKKGWAS